MQLPSQSYAEAIASIAAIRRRNRTLLLLLCLPLFTAFVSKAGVQDFERLSQELALRSDRRIGVMKESQAIALATSLCTRIAGVPAEAISATGSTNSKGEIVRQWNEWEVQCRAGASHYFLRINADRREVVVIRRQQQAGATPQGSVTGETGISGDLPAGSISRQQAQRWAQHYLKLVGLPLPADARLIRGQDSNDFTYQCGSGQGVERMLRVRIDLKDGSLAHLQNVVYRRYSDTSISGTSNGRRP